jgi:amidase
VNCLSEIFFDKALERAKDLDKYYDEHGTTVGPLHGLPISLKDSFNVKGVHTTVAYVSYASNPPAEHNSALVDLLLEQGAVFYVKTNIPQTMMTADTDNPLFGRTLNPLNLTLTAGGSTGGEGSLIALRGSLLGTGTDVGGSLRIPALCNGIYGFKPTSGRVPFAGKAPPGRMGSPSPIIPSIGPEAHCIKDLTLFMNTVIDANPWEFDETSINVPWRQVTAKTNYRFGLILEDHRRPLHPTMLRTMASAQRLIESAGHSIVPLADLEVYEATTLAWSFFLIDPRKTPIQRVNQSGEPWIKSMMGTIPPEVQGLSIDLDKLWDMNVERRAVLRRFHDVMIKNQLDAIILPPYQATAVPHDTYGFPMYTVLANMLDWPAGVIPFEKANKTLDEPFIRNDVKYEPPCKFLLKCPGRAKLIEYRPARER